MTVYVFSLMILIMIENLFVISRNRVVIKQRKIVEYIIILSFCVLFATRGTDIRDTANYISIFENSTALVQTANFSVLAKYALVEGGFWLFNSLFKFIIPYYQVFFGIVAFFTIVYIPKYLSKIFFEENTYSYEEVIRCVYLSCIGVLYSGLVIRAGLAITIGLIAIYYIDQKKLLRGIALFFVAYTLHHSTMLLMAFAVLFVLSKREASDKSKRIVFYSTIVLLFLQMADIATSASNYIYPYIIRLLDSTNNSGEYLSKVGMSNESFGIIKTLCGLSLLITFLCVYKAKIQVRFSCLLISFSTILIMLLTVGVSGSSRIYDMALMFLIPLIGSIYLKWEKTRRLSLLIIFVFVEVITEILKFRIAFY